MGNGLRWSQIRTLGRAGGIAAALLGMALLAGLQAQEAGTNRRECAQSQSQLTRMQEELRIVREMLDQFGGRGTIEFAAAENARNILYDMVMSSVSYFSPMTYLGRYNLARYHLERIDEAIALDHRKFLAALIAALPSDYRLLGPMLQYGPESALGRRHLAAAMGVTWQIEYTDDQDAFLRAALVNAETRRDLYNRYDSNPDGARRHEATLAIDVAAQLRRHEQLRCIDKAPALASSGEDPIARAWQGGSAWGAVVIESNDGGPFIGAYTGTQTALNGEIILTKSDDGRYVGTFKEIKDWPYGHEGELTVTLTGNGRAQITWRDKEGRQGSGEWQ